MKHLLITLLSITLLFAGALPVSMAQTKKAPKEPVYYKIQVAAYKNLGFAKVDTLFSIGKVYAEDAGNGISRVVVGYYTDAAVADKVLAQVRQSGFPDAFVSTQKGEINPNISKELSKQPAAQPPSNTTAAQPMQTFNTQEQNYLLVLGRFASLAEAKLGQVNSLGDMYVEDDKGMKKIVIGPFKDKAVADAALKTAREKGFPDASLQPVALHKNAAPAPPATTAAAEPATGTTTFNAPDNPPAEATYRPGAPLTPPATQIPPPAQLIDFGQFTTYFAATRFDIFNVDPYDPIQEKNYNISSTDPALAAKNKQLTGNALPARLLYLFDQKPNPAWSYFALYRFQISPGYDGYIIRSGIGKYEQDNLILLYVYDKTNMQFIAKETLSTAKGTPGFFTATESWVMDLNADTIPDLLSYTTEEYNSLTQGYKATNKFNAKIWLDNKFVEAQIVNEDKLRQQLGIE
ncbi:hypothetical protein C7N43_11420 [Sphingobacteriales bacterium UPWRP_1]|nr:hypothetical protein C7N43_11420 [Sphingobacteriales bacterium UPWRP_1]